MNQETKDKLLELASEIMNTAQNENEDYVETMAASLIEAIKEVDVE